MPQVRNANYWLAEGQYCPDTVFPQSNSGAGLSLYDIAFTDACQRKDLKATRVRQYRTIPCIELMQATSLTQYVETRTQIQVIGVTQNNLSLHLFAQFREVHALDKSGPMRF